MKKYIILSVFAGYLFVLPAYPACRIDGDAVCTLPEFREQVTPIFKQSSGVKSNIDSSPGQLQPLNRTDPINEMRGVDSMPNYNSGCQFGVCLQNPNKSGLPDNKDIGN